MLILEAILNAKSAVQLFNINQSRTLRKPSLAILLYLSAFMFILWARDWIFLVRIVACQEACRESEATQPLSSTGKDYQPLNHTQKWNPKDSSHILAVKLALHLSAVPEIMICRENEQKRVFEFCKTCIEQGKAGSLYVCGCPGTGKSLLTDKLKSLSVKWAIEAGSNTVALNMFHEHFYSK
eukprot:Gb_30215 [translate_table: standard]